METRIFENSVKPLFCVGFEICIPGPRVNPGPGAEDKRTKANVYLYRCPIRSMYIDGIRWAIVCTHANAFSFAIEKRLRKVAFRVPSSKSAQQCSGRNVNTARQSRKIVFRLLKNPRAVTANSPGIMACPCETRRFSPYNRFKRSKTRRFKPFAK